MYKEGEIMQKAKDIIKDRYQDQINIYDFFNPYRIKENVEPFMGGLPLIFMTTPSMTVYENGEVPETLLTANPLFALLAENDPYILKQLQYSFGGSNSAFIKLATNRFKGITLKDFNMRTVDEHENYYGWKQILPASTVDNFTAESSLTINFSESKNLDMTKLFYAWMCYIEAVRYGLHEPRKITRDSRILDFTSSVYFFLMDFDMRTILYFCKYTGVYPVNVPLGSLIMSDINSKGPIDTSMTFVYQYKEEMNPQIIYDFNAVAGYPAAIYKDTKNGETSPSSFYGDFKNYDPAKDKIEISSSDDPANTLINDGRDYLYTKNYSTMQIRTLIEGRYGVLSETPFNSAENNTKRTLVMEFLTDNDMPSASDSDLSNLMENMKSQKYADLSRRVKANAVDIMGELSSGLVGSATKKQYNDYIEETKKKLGVDEESLDKIKEEYKNRMDAGEMTKEEYDAKLEELQTWADKKVKDNVLDYTTYKGSDEFKNAVRLANYNKLVENATKIGAAIPSMAEYYANKRLENSEKANKATEEFIKYYGGTI